MKIGKILASLVLTMIIAMPFVFGGCNQTPPDINMSITHTVLSNAVDIWEDVKSDAEATTGGVSASGVNIIPSYNGITLTDAFTADTTGEGMILSYTLMYAGLYTVESLTTENTTYELGEIFSINALITQATESSSTYLAGISDANINLLGQINKTNNNVQVELICKPTKNDVPMGQELYVVFNMDYSPTTGSITHFDVLVYDYIYNTIWFFTGITYDDMQGFKIDASDQDTADTAKTAFRTTINTNKNTMANKTATFTNNNFSNEINAGFIAGAELCEAFAELYA